MAATEFRGPAAAIGTRRHQDQDAIIAIHSIAAQHHQLSRAAACSSPVAVEATWAVSDGVGVAQTPQRAAAAVRIPSSLLQSGQDDGQNGLVLAISQPQQQ
jgi:hypothetical protein